MTRLGLEREIVDRGVYDRTVERFRQRKIVLPTFAELTEPATIPPAVSSALFGVGPDDADPLNLFRVHWHNDGARTGFVELPEHVVLPDELTGTPARIVVLLADRFPIIGAHKVLATYGCLAPASSPASSTLRGTRRSGPRRATTAAVAWRCRASWTAMESPSCPRA